MPIPSPTDVKDRRRLRGCCRVVVVVSGFVLRNAKKNSGIAEMMVREASVPTSFKVCRRFSPLDKSRIEERASPMFYDVSCGLLADHGFGRPSGGLRLVSLRAKKSKNHSTGADQKSDFLPSDLTIMASIRDSIRSNTCIQAIQRLNR